VDISKDMTRVLLSRVHGKKVEGAKTPSLDATEQARRLCLVIIDGDELVQQAVSDQVQSLNLNLDVLTATVTKDAASKKIEKCSFVLCDMSGLMASDAGVKAVFSASSNPVAFMSTYIKDETDSYESEPISREVSRGAFVTLCRRKQAT